jgi:hypothetical protein
VNLCQFIPEWERVVFLSESFIDRLGDELLQLMLLSVDTLVVVVDSIFSDKLLLFCPINGWVESLYLLSLLLLLLLSLELFEMSFESLVVRLRGVLSELWDANHCWGVKRFSDERYIGFGGNGNAVWLEWRGIDPNKWDPNGFDSEEQLNDWELTLGIEFVAPFGQKS